MDDADLPRVVAEWAKGEGLETAHPDDLRLLADELIALARKARDANEQLYCWICL